MRTGGYQLWGAGRVSGFGILENSSIHPVGSRAPHQAELQTLSLAEHCASSGSD